MLPKVTEKVIIHVSIIDPNAQSSFHLSRYRIRSCIIIPTRVQLRLLSAFIRDSGQTVIVTGLFI